MEYIWNILVYSICWLIFGLLTSSHSKITIRSARRLIGGLRISCAAQGAVPVLLDVFGIEDVIDVIMKYEYEMKFR